MFRKHENPDVFKAAVLAIAVHAALLVAMLVSIDWKAAHPAMSVTEVELWDKLPSAKMAPPTPTPKPIEKPEPEPPKPEPEPPKPEPKPDPKIAEQKAQEQAEIELEKKKQEKLEQEKLKQDKLEQEKAKKEKLEKLKEDMRDEELKAEKAEKLADKRALDKLKQDMLNEENAEGVKQASAASTAANASIVNQYVAQISAKIKSRINNTACQDGNPVVRFRIDVLPTGELSGNPKLTKTSGSPTCDDAVERAILASVPLPLPDERALKAEFRNLNLIIKPND
jgi:colicin import membrane protein